MPRTRPQKAQQVVDSWLATRESPHSLRAYRASVEAFRRWLGVETVGEAVASLLYATRGAARASVMRWRAAMLDAGAAPSTINLRVGAIRSLVSYACDEGMCGWTLRVVDLDASPIRDTAGPSRERAVRLMAWLGTRRGQLAARDAALVHLLYDLALRVHEACGIDVHGVKLDADPPVVRVRCKGRHGFEDLGLPEPTQDALRWHLRERGDAPGPLFLGRKTGRRLDTKSAYNAVARCGRDSGIGRLTPHGLRHSAITYALEVTGGDVARVSQFSRHRKIQTLMIYDDRRRTEAATIARMVAVPRNSPQGGDLSAT